MKRNYNGFTLIELLVAMTILFSLILITYIPYNHYQNKAKLKLTSREISQSFYDAKNMAVSGIKGTDKNMSVGLYIDTVSGNNSKVTFFSYPYDIEESSINNYEGGTIKIIKQKELQPGVKINYLGGSDNLLFFYESISGKSKVYTFDGSGKTEILDFELPILFSYKNSTSPTLQRELIYFTETNIVDYK